MVPKLSVIMPVYNTEAYLPRSIESVLAQTFSDFEFILVDDGSKDNSYAVCKKYAEGDERIRVFHQENAGALKARLRGVKEARAERMIFIDSDDYVDPDMYERMYAEMETGVDLCFCDISFERMDGTKAKTHPCDGLVKRYTREEILKAFFDNPNMYLGNATNLMMLRTLFEKVDFSTFHFTNREDTYENFFMIFNCSEASYICQPMYHYILSRPGSVCDTEMNQDFMINMVEISRLFYCYIVEKMPDLEPSAFKFEYLVNRNALVQALRDKLSADSRKQAALEYCKKNYKRYISLEQRPLINGIRMQWLLRFPGSYTIVANTWRKIRG